MQMQMLLKLKHFTWTVKAVGWGNIPDARHSPTHGSFCWCAQFTLSCYITLR